MRSLTQMLFSLALLVGVVPLAFSADYGCAPGGLVLEDGAAGMEEIRTVTYDKDKEEFVINGTVRYKNPLTRKDWVRVFKSLKKDDRIGVSVSGDKSQKKFWGELGGDMNETLIEADLLLGGIVYGYEDMLQGHKLPRGYKPKRADGRKTQVILTNFLRGYRFEKKGNTYVMAGYNLDQQIVPLDEKNTSNGPQVDETKMRNFQMESSDSQNMEHFRTYKTEYFQIPPMARAALIGEAAAFARHVRDAKIDHDDLLKQMR